MWATKSALTLGMHHCFFCHGLRMFFSGAGAPSHGTGSQPRPAQPSGPPAGEGSSGRGRPGAGLQARAIRWASPRSFSLRYRWGWVRSLSTPFNPSSAKRRLRRNTVPSDTSRAWATLDADQPSTGLEQDAGPGRNPGWTLPCPDQVAPVGRVPPASAEPRIFSDHTATSQQHLP